jgi:hypothetical protein
VELLSESLVPQNAFLVVRYARAGFLPAIVVVFIAAGGGAVGMTEGGINGYGLAAVWVLLWGAFALASVSINAASRGPRNWVVRATQDALCVKLRSYLNDRLPDDAVVALIHWNEIAGVRREPVKRLVIEFKPGVDLAHLADELAAERKRKQSGNTWLHFPVELRASPACLVVSCSLQGNKDCVPPLDRVLEKLRERLAGATHAKS